MKTIQFRRLFSMPKEGEYSFAIVTYMDSPYIMQTIETPELEHRYLNYVSERRYKLAVDLWLIVLQFRWTRTFTRDTAYEN